MLQCWNLDPYGRPSFEQIVERLKKRMRDAEADCGLSSSTDMYFNVPNTQNMYKTANPEVDDDAATRPVDLPLPLKPGPTEASADDYLTPSEHYYPRDMTSEYLTNPSLSPTMSLASGTMTSPQASLNLPTEHSENSLNLSSEQQSLLLP